MADTVLARPEVIVCEMPETLASDVACAGGALLARYFGARLLLVATVGRGAEVAPAEEHIARYARERLGGLSVTTLVLRGDPVHEIVRLVRTERHPLVVLGPPHGEGALVPLGLEAALAAEAACPVLTISSVEQAQSLIDRLERSRSPGVPCAVCGRPRGAIICASCSNRIAWEALDRKWHEEVHERGMVGVGGARVLGPVVGPPAREP